MADSTAADPVDIEEQDDDEPQVAPAPPPVEVDEAAKKSAEEAKDTANKLFKGAL